MAMQTGASTEADSDPTPKKSPVPILGEGFKENASHSIVPSVENDQGQDTSKKESNAKRRFWQLGKKKDDKSSKNDTTDKDSASESKMRSASPVASPANEASSSQLHSEAVLPSSPGRAMQSSPRLHSPASSQIFERNVQEDVVPVASSPAIPSHITTENHIPPVLDASSMAITDDHLTPDTVEIVTHASHQPASVTVTGTQADSTLCSPIPEEIPPQIPQQAVESNEETASNYGALDSADIRRLSFISFADVVHAEHTQEGSMRDSLMLSGASSIASPNPIARSPSPIRSPVSPLSASGGGSPTFKGLGLESSPGKGGKGPGSPMVSQLSGSPPIVNGELAIETMSSALRKMESGDVGAAARGSFSLNQEGAAPVS